jgi:hypothetical protein
MEIFTSFATLKNVLLRILLYVDLSTHMLETIIILVQIKVKKNRLSGSV